MNFKTKTHQLLFGVTITNCLLMFVLVCSVRAQVEPKASESKQDSNVLHVYEVNKKVTDFPEREDFSTPESAYAVINRVIASGEQSMWRRISVKERAESMPPPDAAKKEVHPVEANVWLNARVFEVRIFRDEYAVVLAEVPWRLVFTKIDLRFVNLEDGRWLNSGEDMADNLEEARTKCDLYFRMIANQIATKRQRIEDPESYLQPFVEFLKDKGEAPKTFVMKALAAHKVVIMGETHHRPLYWGFNSSLVSNPDFPKLIGTIYMELPSNDQALVEAFLAVKNLDTAPIIEMLRDMLWMGWPDQPMLDFFRAVWTVNQNLPPEQRLRIVLVDMQRPWKDIQKREDWRKYETDRDQLMADNILQDLGAHSNEKRNALFIVGIAHAMLNLKYRDGNPMKSAGSYLGQALGSSRVYAIFQHRPVLTNIGQVKGRLCLGLFDSAFAALNNKPLAFPLNIGPFGEQRFDAIPDKPTFDTYQDGYDAYLYLGPLEDEVFSPLIPSFYTDDFVKELDRRYRLMFDMELIEGCGLKKLDAKSFIAWMSNTWGRPRQWKQQLGPINAWHYGDDWEKEIRDKQYRYALEHPEIITEAAKRLFNAIRTADYDNPEVLWNLDYRVYTRADLWIKWLCENFKKCPIKSVELGKVFKGTEGHPTVPYRLIRNDGTVLEGLLPFEFHSVEQRWYGVHGLDWHLQSNLFKEK